MTVVLIVASIVAAWVLVSIALALFLGRAMKVAKQREHERVALASVSAASPLALSQAVDLLG